MHRHTHTYTQIHTYMHIHVYTHRGFPGGPDSKEFVCNAGDLGSIPDGEDSLEKGMATHSSFCLENSMDRKSLAGHIP